MGCLLILTTITIQIGIIIMFITGETSEQKVARLGERPTSYRPTLISFTIILIIIILII
jgi:hypothetical protein